MRAKACANTANGSGRSLAHFAAEHGYTDALHLLLTAKADPNAPNADGDTPAHCAAGSYCQPTAVCEHAQYAQDLRRTIMLQMLLRAKADADRANGTGRVPAHFAAEHGFTSAVRLFVDAGTGAVTAEESNGRTLVCLAAAYDRA